MKQYLQLLRDIKEKGTYKPPARENMPGTQSLFGYQLRHDLSEGFPLLTTKKLSFKNIVVELLWFLKGDTNIKYLVDNGCNIWNEDAYNYYKKVASQNLGETSKGIYHDNFDGTCRMFSYEEFISLVKVSSRKELESVYYSETEEYTLGDCGMQYGKLWRKWKGEHIFGDGKGEFEGQGNRYISGQKEVDQLRELLIGLVENPMSRRHIISAWNPSTLDQMALHPCHALVQFNCRPIPWEVKLEMAKRNPNVEMENLVITEAAAGNPNFGPIPQYYLDCQLYQRSCDVFLGVPYNIASYALLTHILAKICNMIPGEYIHTFGDVHIYDNHKEQVEEQLQREPTELPTLELSDDVSWLEVLEGTLNYNYIVEGLRDYNSQSSIKAKLSTGLK